MQNGDFELGGYTIGRGRPVFASDFQPGSLGDRSSDVENPWNTERYFGRDVESAPVWGFEFSIGEPDGLEEVPDAGVLESMGELAALWRGKWDAREPEWTVPLRYMIGGRIRRVYGRPRNWALNPSVNIEDGNITATAQFACRDALHYEDEQNFVQLQLRPPETGYATLPGVWPLLSYIESERQGQIIVGGDADVLAEEIIFYGPVIDPAIETDLWKAELTFTIPADGWVKIDPRARTVVTHTGQQIPGLLSRSSYLPGMFLTPGAHSFTYSGSDPTGFSSVVVRWRNAYYGL